jgi:putative transposase
MPGTRCRHPLPLGAWPPTPFDACTGRRRRVSGRIRHRFMGFALKQLRRNHRQETLISDFPKKNTGLRVGRRFEYLPHMGRPERPNIPGATYHVMNRGNRKGFIFEDDHDRRQFLRTLVEKHQVHGVKIAAGTLMRNHFHLAIVTPHGNLSEFMERLQGEYARYFNRRHGFVGHVFQGRFRHVQIESDAHLLTALCYLFMNPVTAGLVENLEDYRWSSYAAAAGLRPVPAYQSLEWLQALYPTLSLREAQSSLRKLMTEPRPVAAYIEALELNVSADTIGQVVRSYTGEQMQIASMPRIYRTALRPPLEKILEASAGDRHSFIREARISCGYTNAEIGRALGLKRSTISEIFCEDLRRSQSSLREMTVGDFAASPERLA